MHTELGVYIYGLRKWVKKMSRFSCIAAQCQALPYPQIYHSSGVGSKGENNRLTNRLRIHLRLNFDSMTCLNYLFLDFFQYRKSQADSQVVSQAVFQARRFLAM